METDKPSSTAIFVANGLWWVSTHPSLRQAVPEAMARSNRSMVANLNRGLFSPANRVGARLLRWRIGIMQAVSVPGFYLHFACRKRAIESMVREAIAAGAGQLVVIGAGFDTLSLRVSAEFPRLPVIEIDHPATQAWKRKAIPAQALEPGNLHLLPLDLTRGTLADTLLRSPHYRPGVPAVFVVEGVLMYLREPEVRDLLAFIKSHSGPLSRIVFTYMEERSPGDFQFPEASWLVHFWLGLKREKFTWGLRNSDLGGFLEKSGLALLELKTHRDLRRQWLPSLSAQVRLARGENIAVART